MRLRTLLGEQADSRTPRPVLQLHWLWLGAVALLVELVVIHVVPWLDSDRSSLPVLLPAAHLLLLPFLVRNLQFWGIRLVLVGLLLNLAVMLANGGLMPVDQAAVEAVGRQQVSELQVGAAIPGTKNILLDPEDIRLRELSDRIVLPLPRPLTKAVSFGDLLIFPGFVLTLVEVFGRRGIYPAATRRSPA